MKKLTAYLIISLFLSLPVSGQVPVSPASPEPVGSPQPTIVKPSPAVHEMTEADVGAFLDGLVPPLLAGEDIAGATIVVVKDGKILFSKGYGYADVANKKPVSAEETMFRPGSVSKLFTWTAVMQLVEQGKLELDRDINDYLDFKIPDAFGKPITLKHILTHTPGFEEQIKDLFKFGTPSPNLGDYLKTHIPRRIFEPGTSPAYSNYGTALAGYIVERVSGRPFNEYIEENIFEPLGMTRSTFAQPLPPSLEANMSKGYSLASGEPKPFEVVSPFPAGSMSGTADDMSRFMLAHLQGGQFGEARILRPETVQLMHSRLFGLHPAALGMAHGFYEESRNGHRIIGHGGDTTQFHSDLHLIPDAGVGFFMSYNSNGRGLSSPREVIWEALLDRYFPFTPLDEPTLATAKDDANAVSGTYMSSRRAEGSFFHALALVGELVVAANDDGTIQVAGLTDRGGQPKKFREVGPMTFREVNGQDILVFSPDQDGRMRLILPYPFMFFSRVGFFQNNSILLPVVGTALLAMLLALVLAPVAWLARRHYGHKLELTTTEKRLLWALRITFALILIFIASLAGWIAYAMSNLNFISDTGVMWLRLIQVVGVFGAIGSLIVIYNAAYAWMSSRYRIWGKLQATVFALACLAFLWVVFAGNLLSFTSTF